MAAKAENVATQSENSLPVQVDRDAVRLTAAKMYAVGIKRPAIARALVEYLYPFREFEDGVPIPLEQQLTAARRKLRNWEKDDKFRDLVYKHSVIGLDMATPDILKGLAKRAKRGRVDATRLVLELTGRHNPKGDSVPPQIVVAINGMPRPTVKQIDAEIGETIDQVPEDEDV